MDLFASREESGNRPTIHPRHLRDVRSCFEVLQTLAPELGIPFASLRLDRHGKTDRKSLFGTQAGCSAGETFAPILPFGRPQSLNSTETGIECVDANVDVDVLGGQTVFGIGSLVKLLINVVYILLISHKVHDKLSWDASVCKLYNDLCDVTEEPISLDLRTDPTVKELLLHKHAFAPMMRFLLAPDGSFMPSESEFLRYAGPISNHFFAEKKHQEFKYSNANHIFAALLLEKIEKKRFADVMRERLFEPLKMNRTTLDWDTLDALAKDGNVAQGYRLSASLQSRIPVRRTYLNNTMEAASFGARSCTDDLAKLFQEFFNAIDGKGTIFSREMARFFFGTWTNSSKANPTLAGLKCALDSPVPGCESLNVHSKASNTAGTYKLGTLGGESIWVYYKGGTVDGFASSIYISVYHRTSVIVLSNATGPVDLSDHAARAVLQHAFELEPPVDIVSKVKAERQAASSFVEMLEVSDADTSRWSDIMQHFVGEYVHEVHRQKILITSDAKLIFESENTQSTKFKVFALGRILRIFPEDRHGFVIDRRSEWKDLEFKWSRQGVRYS